MTKPLRMTPLLVCFVSPLLGCGPERLIATPCKTDTDCPNGMLCENYRCVPKESKACENVLDGNPILQPSPHVVDYGQVTRRDSQVSTVALHNIGNCTLTLFEVNLKPNDAFACDLCEETFPKEIFPGRELDMHVAFAPTAVGEASTEIVILSDDKEYPTLPIPIHANYIGTPVLVAAPNTIDFGYVAQGRALQKTVQVTNQGTGTAQATIRSVTLSPAGIQDFTLTVATSLPATLAPMSLASHDMVSFDIRYNPRSLGTHSGTAVVSTTVGDLYIPLAGNSATPPKIDVNPASIDLGDVPLGGSNAKPLTIVNEGGAPLKVRYAWGGPSPSTDLWATPAVVPQIEGGNYVEMQVAVTAAQLGNYNGLLVLTSNDPSKPSLTVPVTARGVVGPGPQAVKIEMTFDNGSDGVFDNDVRRVALTLEHPYGFVCNKQNPAPTNWGAFGHPTWMAFPPKEEPQRIILADATADGTYRVMVQYQEDCASVPTALLAGLLGISVDALIDYLSGGILNVNGKDIAALIQSICLDHKASTTDVRIYVNGSMISQKNTTLSRQGDAAYALDLVHANSVFTVR